MSRLKPRPTKRVHLHSESPSRQQSPRAPRLLCCGVRLRAGRGRPGLQAAGLKTAAITTHPSGAWGKAVRGLLPTTISYQHKPKRDSSPAEGEGSATLRGRLPSMHSHFARPTLGLRRHSEPAVGRVLCARPSEKQIPCRDGPRSDSEYKRAPKAPGPRDFFCCGVQPSRRSRAPWATTCRPEGRRYKHQRTQRRIPEGFAGRHRRQNARFEFALNFVDPAKAHPVGDFRRKKEIVRTISGSKSSGRCAQNDTFGCGAS